MLSPVVVYSLLIIVIHFSISLQYHSAKLLQKPYNHENILSKVKTSLKNNLINLKFSKNLKKNGKTAARLDNIKYADGIQHFEVNKLSNDWKKSNTIENNFKNMLAMKGVTFIYKRDMFWRTWRAVRFRNTSRTTVFYKCSNIISTTCAGCYGGGIWTSDVNPNLCPYEILSMRSKSMICVLNYAQMNKISKSCPSIISLIDLTIACDNPIVTIYRVTKLFKNTTPERDQSDICEGREYCVVLTFYKIYDDYILFRLISSSNEVIYSKIMRNDKKTYTCVSNCGSFDPITKTVSKSIMKSKTQVVLKNKDLLSKICNTYDNKQVTTLSPCLKLQSTTEDYEEESNEY